MKIKYTNLDIFAEVKNLQQYLNFRLINIYELSSKIFILKLTNKIEKVFIKLVSGFRFHTIDEKPQNCKQMPNTFVQKMRKHMNNKRLISVKQYGLDRIVDLQFGENEYAFHIILEIYSTGNVILTDSKYNILSLQRRYVNDEIDISVGKNYPKEKFMKLNFLDNEKVDEWKERGINDLFHKENPFVQLGPVFLKQYDGQVIDYDKIKEDYLNLNLSKGFVVGKTYTPILPVNIEYKEYETFDKMAKDFYRETDLSIDGKKSRCKKNIDNGKKSKCKYERAKKDIMKRTNNLKKKIDKNEIVGQWIYMNADEIDVIMSKIKNMDKNCICNYLQTLETPFISLSYNKKTNVLIVDKHEIDCSITVYANGNRYFQNKKKFNMKYQKTINEGNNAIEKLKKKQSKKEEYIPSFKYVQRKFWFQKFNWYIIDSKYLILCGKTAIQNEELVKKYLNQNNIYLHGDFFGSPSVIVKNLDNDGEIPLNVLLRAGDFLVCMSPNWKINRAENSYYVYNNQVSKTAPTGEYISKGSFMIRGKKNYLPESRLELGIGVLFLEGIGEDIRYISAPIGDKYINCLPVVGPYKDMRNKFKYVVKIKPGRQKQGKMITRILSYFMKNKEITLLEKFLIKQIKNDEWCKIVRSNSHLI